MRLTKLIPLTFSSGFCKRHLHTRRGVMQSLSPNGEGSCGFFAAARRLLPLYCLIISHCTNYGLMKVLENKITGQKTAVSATPYSSANAATVSGKEAKGRAIRCG